MVLTLFEAFLITHLIMDWIFQTSWEVFNKQTKWFPLFVHSTIYTLGFIPAFYFYKVNFLYLIFIFITHFIIDRRTFTLWIMEKVKRMKKNQTSESFWNIILIGIDQTLHLAVLAVIVLLSKY
jgi:hypothetical protein